MTTLNPKAKALLTLAKTAPIAEVSEEKRELMKRAIVATAAAPLLIRAIDGGASGSAGAGAVAVKGVVVGKLAVGAKLAVAVLLTGGVGTSVFLTTRSPSAERAAVVAAERVETTGALEVQPLSDVSFGGPVLESQPSQAQRLAPRPAERSRRREKRAAAVRSKPNSPTMPPSEETASSVPTEALALPESLGPTFKEGTHSNSSPGEPLKHLPLVPSASGASTGLAGAADVPNLKQSLRAREVELLLGATRHLDEQAYASALRAALQYQVQWPQGELLTESLVVQTVALCGLRRVGEAEAAAEKIADVDWLNPATRRLRHSCVRQKFQKAKEKPTD
jgi:hypothetical protein